MTSRSKPTPAAAVVFLVVIARQAEPRSSERSNKERIRASRQRTTGSCDCPRKRGWAAGGSCDARERGWAAGVEAGRDTGLAAEAGRDRGLGEEAEAGRGEGSEFFERIDCSISCNFVISRVICPWSAANWSRLRVICS
jgi:hypothetical protein